MTSINIGLYVVLTVVDVWVTRGGDLHRRPAVGALIGVTMLATIRVRRGKGHSLHWSYLHVWLGIRVMFLFPARMMMEMEGRHALVRRMDDVIDLLEVRRRSLLFWNSRLQNVCAIFGQRHSPWFFKRFHHLRLEDLTFEPPLTFILRPYRLDHRFGLNVWVNVLFISLHLIHFDSNYLNSGKFIISI